MAYAPRLRREAARESDGSGRARVHERSEWRGGWSGQRDASARQRAKRLAQTPNYLLGTTSLSNTKKKLPNSRRAEEFFIVKPLLKRHVFAIIERRRRRRLMKTIGIEIGFYFVAAIEPRSKAAPASRLYAKKLLRRIFSRTF